MGSEIVEMKVKPDEIQLMSFIQITHDGYHGHDDYLLIDSELVLKLDDQNEIAGWEVVNTRTRMESDDQICQCCQAARDAASSAVSNAASNTASRNSYP